MTGPSNILKFTISKPVTAGREQSHPCDANIGDTRVKHAGDMQELHLFVCEHHRLVLESLFGLRLRTLKRKK